MVGPGSARCRDTFARVLAGLLVMACGGRAEGVAPGDTAETEPRAPVLVPERSGPTRLGGSSGATTPSVTPGIAPDAVQTFCYVPAELERTPELEELLAILPDDALDGSGCLAAEYSSLLLPGGCVYDPSGAELSSGRCCYRMDTATDDCSDPR